MVSKADKQFQMLEELLNSGTGNTGEEDTSTGEPQDEKPLYYRANAKSIVTSDGTSVEDELNNIKEDIGEVSDKVDNHTHQATDIIEDDQHQFVTAEEKEKIQTGSVYNNSRPTYAEHGGIPIGTTFQDKTVQEMFNMILYPYISPEVSASVVTPSNGGTFEIGSTVTITKARVIATVKSNDLIKVSISHGANELASKIEGIANGGTFDFDLNYPITANATLTGKVVDDTNAIVSKNTGTFSFVRPIYHGAFNGDSAPTQDQIKALTKHIESKGTKTYQYTCNNERFIFAYPKSYGALSAIYDQNNFNVTDTFIQYTVSVTCLDGNSIDYYVYMSDRTTVTNFNNKFQW